jgi:hypothetical protein
MSKDLEQAALLDQIMKNESLIESKEGIEKLKGLEKDQDHLDNTRDGHHER